MLKVLALLILIVAPHYLTAQVKQTAAFKDSIHVVIRKADTLYEGRPVYEISMINWSRTPVSILHSTGLLLYEIVSPQYVPMSESGDTTIYHLKCAARDTIPAHVYCDQYNAAVILPYQVLRFPLTIAPSHTPMLLRFEYIDLPDLHYKALTDAIHRRSYEWYLAYRRKQLSFVIPH